ncbi:MAG: hypothetical protein N2C14_21315 [Planctomycetales bacterium]
MNRFTMTPRGKRSSGSARPCPSSFPFLLTLCRVAPVRRLFQPNRSIKQPGKLDADFVGRHDERRVARELDRLIDQPSVPLVFHQRDADARGRREGINTKMTVLIFLSAPLLGIMALILAGKVAYTLAGFSPLPMTKPKNCVLPKYIVPFPVEGEDVLGKLSSRLVELGFRELRRDAGAVTFTRGSKLADLFSYTPRQLHAAAPLPLSNPVPLRIEYGTLFGVIGDTGELWEHCAELIEDVEADLSRNESASSETDHPRQDPMETGNPYQSPRS